MVETFIFCRAVSLEELKILRRRVMECQRREEVNHPQRCRDDAIAYFEAFKKYKSQGRSLWNIVGIKLYHGL